ncbi:MAG TPA: class I SAM-dependent methyltransferase [Myxococcaceae bacterium]|nr:class I SAM-dependent methyltransferase [Myxococcaceae bacterium]
MEPQLESSLKHGLTYRSSAGAVEQLRGKVPMSDFVEGYIDGRYEVDGDLRAFLRRKEEVISYRLTLGQVRFILGTFVPSVLVHTRAMDRKLVTGHYDRGNDFFAAFLGELMVYTSAFFETGDETLEQAQTNKLNIVGQKLQLKPGQTLLDVGCGWGTLVRHAARHFGADATGVTLSARQAELGTERIAADGLSDRARILTLDYRAIPHRRYDTISVLEMAEHVGIRKFQRFLRQMAGMLADDGLFFLQIAGLRRNWTPEDFTWGMFMSKYIFPGADASLPLSFVTNQLERAGFEIHSVENIGIHYSLTLDRWYRNWLSNREAVLKGYGERWFRLWKLFLAWSVVITERGSSTCFQIVSHKNTSTFERHRWIGERRRLGEVPERRVPA